MVSPPRLLGSQQGELGSWKPQEHWIIEAIEEWLFGNRSQAGFCQGKWFTTSTINTKLVPVQLCEGYLSCEDDTECFVSKG